MDITTEQRRTTAFYIKRITGLILLLAMAAVFLFSGISKLFAFERFIWNIMDAGVSQMTAASILARLFISFEIMLGLFLVAHIFLRAFTYPAIIALLTLFTIYLVILISRQGDAGNCGCFGDAYEMKPSLAIVKNLLMIAVAVVLIYIYPVRGYRHMEWVAGVTGMTALVLPFIFFPLSGDTQPAKASRPLDLTPLYQSSNPENKAPSIDLRKGKHIVAFMSLTCPHCKKAAFLLQVIHRQHPDYPIFFVLNGHPAFLDDFFKETHSRQVPHILFRGGKEFQSMAGSGVPSIYWIKDGIIEWDANYFQLDPAYMESWLKE